MIANSNLIYNKSLIKIPTSSSDYYINLIRFLLGSVFYFDYTNDPCFIYYNLAYMKCLKAKDGFAVYLGMVLPASECYDISSSTTSIVYNSNFNECH